jgi:hypothetical protein
MRRGRPAEKTANWRFLHSETTASLAAERFGVSKRSIESARVVQKNGIPELVKAVDEGTACHVCRENCEHETRWQQEGPG